MCEFLKVLLGLNVTGFSPVVVSRLKRQLEQERRQWMSSCLDEDRWLYLWADGVCSGLRCDAVHVGGDWGE